MHYIAGSILFLDSADYSNATIDETATITTFFLPENVLDCKTAECEELMERSETLIQKETLIEDAICRGSSLPSAAFRSELLRLHARGRRVIFVIFRFSSRVCHSIGLRETALCLFFRIRREPTHRKRHGNFGIMKRTAQRILIFPSVASTAACKHVSTEHCDGASRFAADLYGQLRHHVRFFRIAPSLGRRPLRMVFWPPQSHFLSLKKTS